MAVYDRRNRQLIVFYAFTNGSMINGTLEHLDMAGAPMAEPASLDGGMIMAREAGLGMAWNEDAIARFQMA
jgi:hypothetical protein